MMRVKWNQFFLIAGLMITFTAQAQKNFVTPSADNPSFEHLTGQNFNSDKGQSFEIIRRNEGNKGNKSSGTSEAQCRARLTGKNGCYESKNGCQIGFQFCNASNCARNGGKFVGGSCVSPSLADSDECGSPKESVACCKKMRGESFTLVHSGGTIVCAEESKSVAKPQCDGSQASFATKECCMASSEHTWSESKNACSLREAPAVVKNPEAAPTQAPNPGDSAFLLRAKEASFQCEKAVDEASNSCSDEKNPKYNDLKNQTDQMTNQFRGMSMQAAAQGASATPWANMANTMSVVGVGLEAIQFQCESTAKECINKCQKARSEMSAAMNDLNLNGDEVTIAREKGEFTSLFSTISKNSSNCGDYEGAAQGIAQKLLEAMAARNRAAVNAACTANTTNPNCAYCLQNPNASICNNLINQVPGITLPTTAACDPSKTNCSVQGKVRDNFNPNATGTDGGRFGSTSRGSDSSSLGSGINWGESENKMVGSATKPYELSNPNSANGGGGGGLGGGGVGGGGSGEGGSGSEGYAGGDSLFEGTKAIGGGSDPRLGALGSGSSGSGAGLSGRSPTGKMLDGKEKIPFDPNMLRDQLGMGRGGVRGVAGATGPDGITGPDTVIWKKVNNAVLNDPIYNNPIGVEASKSSVPSH